MSRDREPILNVDFGSTFTKAVVVDPETGSVIASASHPTTVDTDVMDAYDAICPELGMGADWEVRACSSAGGGLRIAVVGNECLVTAEAGRRVATSSGGRVVRVLAGRLDPTGIRQLTDAAPDVILLVGGTDGGNTAVLRHNAGAVASLAFTGPVVVAGNAACADEVAEVLAVAGTAFVTTDNVVPAIGVLHPDPARSAIRSVFVEHVIGGRRLSTRAEFGRIVRGPTPDLVLRGVEVVAAVAGCDVAVVDVGGATTDVHSVTATDEPTSDGDGPGAGGGEAPVVGFTPARRTVEADLGLRSGAVGIIEAAGAAGLLDELDPPAATELGMAAERRAAEPGLIADTPEEIFFDEWLAGLAVTVALRRHAGRADAPDRGTRDLRGVRLLVASGGVFRLGLPGLAEAILTGGIADPERVGWRLPRRPSLIRDRTGVLAAIGLLADDRPDLARRLALTYLSGPTTDTEG